MLLSELQVFLKEGFWKLHWLLQVEQRVQCTTEDFINFTRPMKPIVQVDEQCHKNCGATNTINPSTQPGSWDSQQVPPMPIQKPDDTDIWVSPVLITKWFQILIKTVVFVSSPKDEKTSSILSSFGDRWAVGYSACTLSVLCLTTLTQS